MADHDIEYTFHCYDHCPYGNRSAFLMDKHGLKYKKVVYGYGSGAKPEDCDGNGYEGELNPRTLTGNKQLPVLEGPGVPVVEGAKGMPESLEICAFLIARHQLVVPCATGRGDVEEWTKQLFETMVPLCMHRMVKMPVTDWAVDKDVEYYLWKHSKEDPDAVKPLSPEEDAALTEKLNAHFAALPALMHGEDCLNSWGWGMDDVLLLPWLRRLTMIKAAVFPPKVQAYIAQVGQQVEDYSKHAI